jgi:hypothetical protein
MVKAYDRPMMISFLLKVMERMGFPEVFRRWIKMLHHKATNCLVLPNGLSRFINVMFSFRQGYPIAIHPATVAPPEDAQGHPHWVCHHQLQAD